MPAHPTWGKISTRAWNALDALNIVATSDFVKVGAVDVLNVRNVGRHTLHELRAIAERHGATLGCPDCEHALILHTGFWCLGSDYPKCWCSRPPNAARGV